MGPIITQSAPKVQTLIILPSHDRKIKDLAPIALLSVLLAPMDPRCANLLTVDFKKAERETKRERGIMQQFLPARSIIHLCPVYMYRLLSHH